MNINQFDVRDIQLILENLEMADRINRKLSQQSYEGEYMKGVVWGMEHANSSYTQYLKQLRSVVERIGKGNMHLIEDVRLDGGEDHVTA